MPDATQSGGSGLTEVLTTNFTQTNPHNHSGAFRKTAVLWAIAFGLPALVSMAPSSPSSPFGRLCVGGFTLLLFLEYLSHLTGLLYQRGPANCVRLLGSSLRKFGVTTLDAVSRTLITTAVGASGFVLLSPSLFVAFNFTSGLAQSAVVCAYSVGSLVWMLNGMIYADETLHPAEPNTDSHISPPPFGAAHWVMKQLQVGHSRLSQ